MMSTSDLLAVFWEIGRRATYRALLPVRIDQLASEIAKLPPDEEIPEWFVAKLRKRASQVVASPTRRGGERDLSTHVPGRYTIGSSSPDDELHRLLSLRSKHQRLISGLSRADPLSAIGDASEHEWASEQLRVCLEEHCPIPAQNVSTLQLIRGLVRMVCEVAGPEVRKGVHVHADGLATARFRPAGATVQLSSGIDDILCDLDSTKVLDRLKREGVLEALRSVRDPDIAPTIEEILCSSVRSQTVADSPKAPSNAPESAKRTRASRKNDPIQLTAALQAWHEKSGTESAPSSWLIEKLRFRTAKDTPDHSRLSRAFKSLFPDGHAEYVRLCRSEKIERLMGRLDQLK